MSFDNGYDKTVHVDDYPDVEVHTDYLGCDLVDLKVGEVLTVLTIDEAKKLRKVLKRAIENAEVVE